MINHFNEFGILLSILGWLVNAFLPLIFKSNRFNRFFFYPSIGASVAIIYFAYQILLHPTHETLILPLGLPDYPFLVRIDSLSCLFLMVLGIGSVGISLHASAYFKDITGSAFYTTFLFYQLFLVGMGSVFISNDGYSFLIAWELMALTSYFLVTVNHHASESRSAGFIYLLVSHMGAAAILLSLGVMQQGVGNFSFDYIRQVDLSSHWKLAAMGFALLGFGFKAGLVPLHVWLPEAHPAAPSPISAMMSGVMVKTAIYGFIRFVFDLMGGDFPTWVGLIVMVLGLLSAFYSVIYAIVQSDMKRLLAYSTIENMGLIFGITGLSLVFLSLGRPALSAMAMVAVLYHCLSHSVFKSLLFLSTGNVLHATGERNLGKLGGLIKFMPWVAGLSLIGALGMAGLPPLNGFASEWMMIQSFLAFTALPESYLTLILPLCAALFILVAGLAGYLSVKFFGIIFLGQPREKKLHNAQDVGLTEKLALIYLAGFCIVLGVLPNVVIAYLKPIASTMCQIKSAISIFPTTGFTVIPATITKASYNPLLYLIFIVGLTLSIWMIVKFRYHKPIRRTEPWACGQSKLLARSQDTAEGFGQPLKQIFGYLMDISRNHYETLNTDSKYVSVVKDWAWLHIYEPVVSHVERISGIFSKLQQGKINIYLIYSVLTTIILLVMVRWILY